MGFKKLVNDIKVEKRRKLIAIYCRVSTEEQSENGYSIDEQERLLEEWCKKMGYVIYKCYSDRGISGKNIKDRPALKELLSDAKAGKFDMVISWKINRVSRKLEDVLKIVNLLEKNNITFKSYSEPFETDTPAGRMQFQMMALIGEFERGTIAQNVKMGMIAKAKSGNWCGGRVLGYDLVPNNSPEEEKKGKNKLKINEKEAEIVRFIFNEYSKGKGYKAITNQINKLGYKTKKGNDFSVGSIRDILTNPVYIGEIRYNVRQNWSEKRRRNINPNPIRVKGKHEAIIDRELWDKVQLILESKKGKPSRIYDGEYPLTGILRCPKCGAGMVISRTTNTLADGSKKRIAYYCCGNWKNKGTSVCNSNTIRVDKANEYVFKKIEELVSNEAMIKAVVKNINKERKDKVKPAKRLLGDIDKELEKLDKRKRKIFEAYEDDILTKAEFQIRKDELNEKIRILEEEKKPLLNTISEDVSEEIPYEFIKDILMNFSKILNSSVSREQQKKLLHMIISEITMNESREIESIKLNINDKLVEYLVKEGGVPIKGIPSSFMLINVGLKVLNLDVVI
ncbi:recombinase family protein [Clostridium perfringens]|uniref:Recombinase family protein n=1 Tax=Clostridium perfringens TaxID=1502 RepID=A0AAW9HV83_CLOPF|nr:recombinase family protein [Clostridium perfringens]MBI6013066.1 recombinase family protein [Clostridium perfringens]MDZ4908253.1 recombinase family protein [Clostridium perfringens]MDZ4990686.1 recombinase family protein [Clostridium perfringens]MDZ5029609.1 recombinase family protein [Clostridium perfringens]MDZ5062880.1 recombinase family protein [Clostridium perfringens]